MSSVRIRLPLPGPLVKRLRHRPFTAVTWVRFPYGSPEKFRHVCVGTFLYQNPYGNRKAGPEGETNMPVAYWSGRGRFPPDRTSQGRNLTGRGGERSLPGVTKEIPTLVRRNFFESKPVRESPGRARSPHVTNRSEDPNIPSVSLPGKNPGKPPAFVAQRLSALPTWWHVFQDVGDSPRTGPDREGTLPIEVGSGAFPGSPEKFRHIRVGTFLMRQWRIRL